MDLSRRLDRVVVALAGGVAAVAGSYAAVGDAPAFVATPIANAAVTLAPGTLVTLAITILGDLGSKLAYGGGLAASGGQSDLAGWFLEVRVVELEAFDGPLDGLDVDVGGSLELLEIRSDLLRGEVGLLGDAPGLEVGALLGALPEVGEEFQLRLGELVAENRSVAAGHASPRARPGLDYGLYTALKRRSERGARPGQTVTQASVAAPANCSRTFFTLGSAWNWQ